jgi:hypothetical protein
VSREVLSFDALRVRTHNQPVNATPPDQPASPVGPAIVLVGAAGFIVACFLPFYGVALEPGGEAPSTSLYRLNVILFPGDGFASQVGGFVQLFAGVAIIASIAILLLRNRPRTWARPAMVGAVAVWSLWWFGMLLSASIFPSPRHVGYWAALLTVTLVGVGTIVSLLASRRRAAARDELDE